MERYSQTSITIGALGIMLALIGLFPGIIGLETVAGVGVLQVLVILLGFSFIFIGAYIFVNQMFYPGLPTTLGQDIGIRLTLTGLLIAAAAGLADVLGFGTHGATNNTRPLMGRLQALGFIGGFLIASLGVGLFALFGPDQDEQDDATPTDGENSEFPPPAE
ncbi:MAG: hypothetical protein JXA10_12925 [Anaerolineae bacterium]|nr:hypothetical protein [Anaerolineae bacterium]